MFQIRNYFNNQNKRILVLEKNNSIITNKLYTLTIQFLVFFNFTKLINYINYNYIYSNDGLIFYENLKFKNTIKLNKNIIVNFLFNNIDITNQIKKYQLEVPLNIIYYLEKLNKIGLGNNIEIKILNLYTQKIYIKYYEYDIIKYNKLHELL